MDEQETLLTAEQLAPVINVKSKFAVYALVYKKKIPVIRLGPNSLRFSRSAVMAALKKLEQKEAGAVRS